MTTDLQVGQSLKDQAERSAAAGHPGTSPGSFNGPHQPAAATPL